MCVFELNLMKKIEDNEACEIEKETERLKCKEIMSELEVRNDEIESDLKDKMLKLYVSRKRAKRATKK